MRLDDPRKLFVKINALWIEAVEDLNAFSILVEKDLSWVGKSDAI